HPPPPPGRVPLPGYLRDPLQRADRVQRVRPRARPLARSDGIDLQVPQAPDAVPPRPAGPARGVLREVGAVPYRGELLRGRREEPHRGDAETRSPLSETETQLQLSGGSCIRGGFR